MSDKANVRVFVQSIPDDLYEAAGRGWCDDVVPVLEYYRAAAQTGDDPGHHPMIFVFSQVLLKRTRASEAVY